MEGIYLLLGTNLGDRMANLQRAKELMMTKMITVMRESSVYETAAWGIEDQPSFLNQVVQIDFNRPPARLLELLLEIEQQMGRIREEKWGSRLIDIDILYFKGQIVDSKELKIPHPEIQNRRFTLLPLVELAPDLQHPILKNTQEELLGQTPDQLEVKIFNN